MVAVALAAGRLVVAFFLVAANGFFVAAEFAFVRVRSTAVEQAVAEGRRGATALSAAMDNLDDYLAVTQLGITIASIGLGWIGEPAVAALLEPLLERVAPGAPISLIAFLVGFSFVTFLHVVFGELAPKTISIARAEQVALMVATPMKLCYYLFVPGIIVFNGTANFFTRLLGIPPASESEETLSEPEILSVLSRASQEGTVAANEVEMIERVFALDDIAVREVMVPRPDAESVSADLSLSALVSRVTTTEHTRYPVLDEADEQVVGFVDAKDVLTAMSEEADGSGERTAGDLAREMPVIPESTRLDALLRRFQTERIQMIAVIDEWGAFEGIVTVEDVVERIVGDLWDAFDVVDSRPVIERQADGQFLVSGDTSISAVNETIGADLESAGYGTVAGLVMDRLGRLPEGGDAVAVDGYRVEVMGVEDTRIETVMIHPPDTAAAEPADPDESPS